MNISPDDNTRKKVVMIVLTHSCNLNCIYCYEHHGNRYNSVMNANMAMHIIEKETEIAIELHNDLIIHFMGGEPLLCFAIIQDICEWIENREWPIKIELTATTNGTLIAAHKEWLWNHRNTFKPVLSTDGDKIMQDLNRSKSFDSIDYDFYLLAWSDGKIKMTISPSTVNKVARGVVFLHNKGFQRIDANIALGPSIEWNKEHIAIYRQELRKLIKFYLSNPDHTPVSMLNYDITRIVLSHDWRKRCSCGEQLICYDTDGIVYPCHLFSPVTLDKNQLTQLQHFDFSNREIFFSEKCSKCLIRMCCLRCPGMSFQYTKTLGETPSILCYVSQIEFLSTCTLLYSKLKLHQDVPNAILVEKTLERVKRIITLKKI